MSSRGPASRPVVYVDLPTANPFASDARARSHGGATSIGRRNGRAVGQRIQTDEDAGSAEEEGVTVLPSVNPFGSRSDRGDRGRDGPMSRSTRSSTVVADNPSEDELYYPPTRPADARSGVRYVTQSPSPPPLRRTSTAPVERPSSGPAQRLRASASQAFGDHEQSADELVRQRMGNPRHQLRSVGRTRSPEAEDNRLVISWLGDTPTAQPAPSKPHPGGAGPRRPPSVSSVTASEPATVRFPGGRAPSDSRYSAQEEAIARSRHGTSHYDPVNVRPGPHAHREECHCHHRCVGYQHPYGYPRFPVPPPEWQEYYRSRQPYASYPYSFGRPLYAEIPELPSLDQCRAPYPALPVPPVAFLRDLRAEVATGGASSSRAAQAPNPNGEDPQEFDHAFELIQANNTSDFLTSLSRKEFSSSDVDQILCKLTNVVQVRFSERQGDQIVNRVHVVPRGRLAFGTIMAAHPKLDVDLVLPSDFVLRRWNIFPQDQSNALRPKTVADVLGLNPASIARGEIDAAKLRWVFQAVWEQFNGSVDGFIFPGGSNEASKYLPQNWCALYKDNVPESNRLRLVTLGNTPVYINVFVKVALSLHGQEMIVGVDQGSAKSAGQYQMVKVLRSSGAPLSEAPLPPVHRTAILTLNWWQYSLKLEGLAGSGGAQLPTPKIRTSHFLLALAALGRLDPTDELYVPSATAVARPFSLLEVLETILKILKYLERAYKSALTLTNSPIPGPSNLPIGGAMQYTFPLSSCTTMDVLYNQASAKPDELLLLDTSLTVPNMIMKVQAAIGSVNSLPL